MTPAPFATRKKSLTDRYLRSKFLTRVVQTVFQQSVSLELRLAGKETMVRNMLKRLLISSSMLHCS